MNTAPASLHTINASEACGRDTAHNAHCANLRAYRVARHYDNVNAPREIDMNDPLWTRASVAPDLRWHGTRNLVPRERIDDADRQRITRRHVMRLNARERECGEWNLADAAARDVALHYCAKNAPWV